MSCFEQIKILGFRHSVNRQWPKLFVYSTNAVQVFPNFWNTSLMSFKTKVTTFKDCLQLRSESKMSSPPPTPPPPKG